MGPAGVRGIRQPLDLVIKFRDCKQPIAPITAETLRMGAADRELFSRLSIDLLSQQKDEYHIMPTVNRQLIPRSIRSTRSFQQTRGH